MLRLGGDGVIYLSMAALSGAALLLLRAYLAYLTAARDECLGFLSLLNELERSMSLYLEAPRPVFERASRGVAALSPFAEGLGEGMTPAEAFAAAVGKLSLPEEAARVLREYFSRVGEGYLDGELRALRRAISELEPVAERSRGELEKRGRVAGVLIFSALAGAFILFL